ncbi:hypothetical protein ACFVP0_30305 [Streptomyces cinereoruber]|uniref:hypothetical protein n=1 Tax=Streptomyces cinereoruber TaxID=67260 RepID=UPI003681B88D
MVAGEGVGGESALLSWLVLRPPAGVHVVSFFVTARFAGQSDREAFIDVVMEQLAALLGRSVPAHLAGATRAAHLLALLDDAATVCREQGSRLVLVVDGLDEALGVTAGPDAYSIAALLPARPPAGMRVIVAGRLAPPLPGDMPDRHPLREPAAVRLLEPSRDAEVIRDAASTWSRRPTEVPVSVAGPSRGKSMSGITAPTITAGTTALPASFESRPRPKGRSVSSGRTRWSGS